MVPATVGVQSQDTVNVRFSVSRWQVISASIWAACISRYRWRRLSACDAVFFPQPASSSTAASSHTKHFFTVNPPFPEGFPLSL